MSFVIFGLLTIAQSTEDLRSDSPHSSYVSTTRCPRVRVLTNVPENANCIKGERDSRAHRRGFLPGTQYQYGTWAETLLELRFRCEPENEGNVCQDICQGATCGN
jgi:hypothetical protein